MVSEMKRRDFSISALLRIRWTTTASVNSFLLLVVYDWQRGPS